MNLNEYEMLVIGIKDYGFKDYDHTSFTANSIPQNHNVPAYFF